MPLYEHNSNLIRPNGVYYFCGSTEVWKALIIQSCFKGKETYLFDSSAISKEYPKTLKLIKSKVTAKRLLRGVSLRNATIFADGQHLGKDLVDFPYMLGSMYSNAVVKIPIKALVGHLCLKNVIVETKRTAKFLSKYK